MTTHHEEKQDETVPLVDANWEVEIRTHHFRGGKFDWAARGKGSDLFSTICNARGHETVEAAEQDWIKFAEKNKYLKFKFIEY